jgi:hypothetical protein
LELANKEVKKDAFSLDSDTLEINYGFLFSKTGKHLVINRFFPWNILTNIYKVQNGGFTQVFVLEKSNILYRADSIMDINGDKKPDYVFNWYPLKGEGEFSDVYIQKPNGEFSDKLEFVNPCFSPEEKVIRGTMVGQNPPLYKFKWNGFALDTVEYIYFPDNSNGLQYIKRKRPDLNEKGEIIERLPEEYKKMVYGE